MAGRFLGVDRRGDSRLQLPRQPRLRLRAVHRRGKRPAGERAGRPSAAPRPNFALASALTAPLSRSGTGRLATSFSSTAGVVKIAQFTATSDTVKVTAEGTVDLRRRQVSGRARGNLRGLFGIATGPLGRTLEMEVSLDNIRVRPIGLKGIWKVPATLVPDTAKGASGVNRNSVALPLRVFYPFKPDSSDANR